MGTSVEIRVTNWNMRPTKTSNSMHVKLLYAPTSYTLQLNLTEKSEQFTYDLMPFVGFLIDYILIMVDHRYFHRT